MAVKLEDRSGNEGSVKRDCGLTGVKTALTEQFTEAPQGRWDTSELKRERN